MRIVLIASLLLTQSLADNSAQYQQCKTICNEYEKSKLKSNTCQAALNVSPKPSTHKACTRGEIVGYDHACLPSCMGKPHEGRSYEPGNSYEACKRFRNKQSSLMWCRTGYDRSYKQVKEDIERKVATIVPEEEAKEDIERIVATIDPEEGDEINEPNLDAEKGESGFADRSEEEGAQKALKTEEADRINQSGNNEGSSGETKEESKDKEVDPHEILTVEVPQVEHRVDTPDNDKTIDEDGSVEKTSAVIPQGGASEVNSVDDAPSMTIQHIEPDKIFSQENVKTSMEIKEAQVDIVERAVLRSKSTMGQHEF